MVAYYLLALVWAGVLFWLMQAYSPSRETYIKSFLELLCVYIVGNVHYLFLLFDFYVKSGDAFSFTEFLKSEVKPGEILVYVSAVLAPVTYTFIAFYKAARPSWHVVQFASIFISLSLGIWIFGSYRSVSIGESAKIRDAAIILYCVSLSLCFFSAVYDRAINEAGGAHKDGAKDLLDKLKQAGY